MYNGIQTGFTNSVWKEGYDSNTWYLVRWAGVDPADGMPMWYDKDGNLTKTYSTDDRVADKSATPIGFGGLINNLTYGNWSLSFQINYVIGGYSLPTYASRFIKDGIQTIPNLAFCSCSVSTLPKRCCIPTSRTRFDFEMSTN